MKLVLRLGYVENFCFIIRWKESQRESIKPTLLLIFKDLFIERARERELGRGIGSEKENLKQTPS